MFKFIKSFCVFSIVLLLPFLFIGCKDNNQPKDKIKIGDVSYQTLTQAVENTDIKRIVPSKIIRFIISPHLIIDIIISF